MKTTLDLRVQQSVTSLHSLTSANVVYIAFMRFLLLHSFFNNCFSEGGCLFADVITLETRSLACSDVFVRKLLLFSLL